MSTAPHTCLICGITDPLAFRLLRHIPPHGVHRRLQPTSARSVGSAGCLHPLLCSRYFMVANNNTVMANLYSSDEKSADNRLRFLERPLHASTSSSSMTAFTMTASPGPRQEGYSYMPQARDRGATIHSALAFLERRNPGGTAIASSTPSRRGSSAGTVDGADGGLRTGMIAASTMLGGLAPDWGDRSSDGDILAEDDDDNICPSMLFSCFPCLACFRPGKRRRPSSDGQSRADGLRGVSRLQTSLTTPLLSDGLGLPPQRFPKDVKLLEVEVEYAKNVPVMDMRETDHRGSDPAGRYVSLRIIPLQEGVGEQARQTCLARKAINPRWGHQDTFTFFVTDTGASAKVFLSVHLMHRPPKRPVAPIATLPNNHSAFDFSSHDANLPTGAQPGDVEVGKGFVDLLRLFPDSGKGNIRRLSVPIRSARKRRTRCVVMLGIRCRRVNETIDTQEDRLFEYQRWTPAAGWSATGSRDSRRWSTVDGSVFSESFAGVAPPARGDSEVVLPWCPFGGWEYSKGEEGAAGADEKSEYKADNGNDSYLKRSSVWSERPRSTGVRRRLWRRVYRDHGSALSEQPT